MPTGTISTYTANAPVRRSIADIIHMIDPREASLLDLFGIDNAKKFKLEHWPNTRYEWLQDSMPVRRGTLNEALDDSETGVDVQTGEGALLKTGDILVVESEQMYVASVATDTATVVRGYAGTTAAAHADDTPWYRAMIARKESASATTGYVTTLENPYNFTQIIAEAVKVSGSAEVNTTYGINDQMAHHISRLIGGGDGMGGRNKAGVLPLMLQNTFYYGQRYVGTDDASREMGGFEYFVTTNVEDLSNRALDRQDIEDLQQACFDNGGDPETIVCGSWLKRKITTLYKENVVTNIDTRKGGGHISRISTDLGELNVVLDRFCPSGRLYMCEKDKLGWIPFRPFGIYDRSSDGDYKLKDVLGEYGFVLLNEKGHGYLKNVSMTD